MKGSIVPNDIISSVVSPNYKAMERLETGKAGDDSVLVPLSPALKYESMLMECGGPALSEDKTILVFKVLDQITPHLGVFVKLMKMCRDELFEAIYSDQYTGSNQEQEGGAGKYIQRVPYFKLVKSCYDERDEKNEQLSEQLENVKQRLFDKQKQFEDATDTIENLEKNIVDLKKNIADLEQTVKDRLSDIDNLEKTLEDLKKETADKEHELNCDIAELQENLDEANTQNAYLKQFKDGYDELQEAFADHSAYTEPITKKKAVVADKRAHLISGIENCNKLEMQLLTVQNSNIEEFENFLDAHKRQMLKKDEDDDFEGYDDVDVDRADQQLQVLQMRFTKVIKDIDTELSLLRQHRLGLQEQLQIIEENKPTVKKKRKSKVSRPTTQESSKLQSLTEGLGGDDSDNDGEGLDSFSIQERVFSKFAAMLYTSDNGKTFHEFRGAKYCQSCGEKTVLCPHKILQQEHTFVLPPNVSHIKIIRPKVRINMELIDGIVRPQTVGMDTVMSNTPDGKATQSRVSISGAQVSPLVESTAQTPAESADLGMLGDTLHFSNTIQRLWLDYKSRTDLERVVMRPLPCDQALSLIEQFAAYLAWLDQAHREDEKAANVLDTLYAFMTDRYQVPDMALLVTHDLITALVENCSSNKFIWLFTQVLIGNLDASVFRYMLLIGDFINQVEWKTVEDFRAFSSVVYPTLTEDDLETLQMGYISFSENKVSSSLVAEYIIYTIMKYREPRFLEMENVLLAKPGQNSGSLTLAEFTEATDNILDVPNNKLRKRLYGESLAYVTSKDNQEAPGVPNLRLAQICSYLQLLHISPLVNENVKESVESAREVLAADTQGDSKAKPSNAIPSQFQVLGMSDVMVIANNIARRRGSRKIRH